MADLTYVIGDFDPQPRTVAVTFTDGDIVHSRTVNACVTEAGTYDAQATRDRIASVALGVATKIRVGAIVNPPVDDMA